MIIFLYFVGSSMSLVLGYLIIKQFGFINRTNILYLKTQRNEKIIKKLGDLNFKPTFYLPNFTTQIIYNEYAPIREYKFVREYIHTTDLGIISLDWVIDGNMNFNKILIILHGMMGGSETNYIRDIINGFLKAGGYKIVIVHNRGINDTPLLTPFSFHAAYYHDLKQAINWVRERYGNLPCYGLGVSFGANIWTKLLAHDHSVNNYIKGFVSVSNPLNMHESERLIRHNYLGFFLYKALKNYLELHSMLRVHQDLQFEILSEIRTPRDIDNNFTCKMHKFKDADEYYISVSSGPDIAKIKVPCLFLNAKDDVLAPYYSVDLKPCKI
jgi:predicted alpha/beta-fold hydrolase